MFWSGNYIAVRELNFLLKEENVTLTQVLEADDILQECKADNKALIQFLTKPKILAELITLITEEPPKNVELLSQYRHASIACEVLTSHLSTLSDRLSMDAVQMNRLCDFINRDPPLNPLLASYFSKTIEMLLERSPKQDWYLYHVVCLRVLDFFKSRRDFLPNLLRHISTSAIADTFKYFIRLDDLFNKIIMEWFEEHQFLECLIQIICGTYAPEPPGAEGAGAGAAGGKAEAERSPDRPEKGQLEPSEKHPLDNDVAETHGDTGSESAECKSVSPEETPAGTGAAAGAGAGAEADARAERARRVAGVASANAAALLCDLVLSGCAGEGCNTRPRTSWALVSRLQSAGGVRLVLQGMFTAPAHARAHALVHGAHVLRALLDQEPILGGECESERTSVELAVAPHLPLLHQALLEQPPSPPGSPPGAPPPVGLPRVQVAALLAHLALSEVEEVATTMLTLGTPGVVVDMVFAHPHNNFLHAQAYALVKHALANKVYRTQYARHLLVECDLLTRLMDVFEENENKDGSCPRSAYMGHVTMMLRRAAAALEDGCATLPPPLARRWDAFRAHALAPALQRHDTPLGGFYPSENIYEFIDVTATASLDDVPGDLGVDAYNEMCSANDSTEYLADELDLEVDKNEDSKNNFLELASQRFDDVMWEDSPEAEGEGDSEGEADADDEEDRVRELLDQHSPWESSGGGSSSAGAGGAGGWAQFDAFGSSAAAAGAAGAAPAPDPFAPEQDAPAHDDFAAFWPYGDPGDAAENSSQQELETNVRNLNLNNSLEKLDDASSVDLANKLLTAMSGMAPEDVATLVNSVPALHARPHPGGAGDGEPPGNTSAQPKVDTPPSERPTADDNTPNQPKDDQEQKKSIDEDTQRSLDSKDQSDKADAPSEACAKEKTTDSTPTESGVICEAPTHQTKEESKPPSPPPSVDPQPASIPESVSVSQSDSQPDSQSYSQTESPSESSSTSDAAADAPGDS